MLKSFSILKRNGAHLVRKRTLEKNKDYPFSRFQCFEHAKTFCIMSSFEHVKFPINEKYSKRIYDNPNYYVSYVILQTYKNTILRSVHSLGWLL
jgi:hypothetical protein